MHPGVKVHAGALLRLQQDALPTAVQDTNLAGERASSSDSASAVRSTPPAQVGARPKRKRAEDEASEDDGDADNERSLKRQRPSDASARARDCSASPLSSYAPKDGELSVAKDKGKQPVTLLPGSTSITNSIPKAVPPPRQLSFDSAIVGTVRPTALVVWCDVCPRAS